MLIDKEFKIGDVVLVTANAAELKIVAADLALLGQTATITESLHCCCFRLSGPSLPTCCTWVQAKHIELVEAELVMRAILTEAGYDSESIVDDLRDLVTDSRRPATEEDEGVPTKSLTKQWWVT